MHRLQHHRSGRGFTLVEMLVVLGILTMLLAMVVPRIMGTQKKADISATQSQVKLLRGCLQQYFVDMREFPSTEQGLKALVEKPVDLSEGKTSRWDGPYIESGEMPKDSWGNDFQYEYPPKHGTTDYPDIWSLGPDGQDGTEDDIVSWSQESSKETVGAVKSKGGSQATPAPAKPKARTKQLP
jgi:general secretion pathway protein G